MTDGEALLAAIVAQPAEDTVRLVFADWLDERGAEGDAARAEFIRVQIEIARFPAAEAHLDRGFCPGCYARRESPYNARDWHWTGCRWAELRRRERELLCGGPARRPNAFAWFDPPQLRDGSAWWLANFDDDDSEYNCRFTFARGFVESVRCPAADWLAHADLIRARQPVTKVVLAELDRGLLLGRDLLYQRPEDGGKNAWHCDRYPGVEFELSPAQMIHGDQIGSVLSADVMPGGGLSVIIQLNPPS